MTRKILTVVGARPQFIKASALSKAISDNKGCTEIVVHTGQHYDVAMSEIFFRELNMKPPQYNLGIHHLSHGAMTGRMLEELEKVLLKEIPDVVVLYGDTNSTLAGALAASKLGIPIAHIEAGLRSYNWSMPEEQNRVITDRLSRFLFVPSEKATKNLEVEGIYSTEVEVVDVGDIMYDVFLQYEAQARADTEWLKKEEIEAGTYLLASIHRQENVNDPTRLRAIFEALDEVHEHHFPVLCPIHPRTAKALKASGISTRIHQVQPLSYLKMLSALVHCKAVITDSGGLQKEAYYAKKLCYTMRNETEWTELLSLGANFLISEANTLGPQLLNLPDKEGRADFSARPYGHGRSAQSILSALLTRL